jgi:hypothetical protein
MLTIRSRKRFVCSWNILRIYGSLTSGTTTHNKTTMITCKKNPCLKWITFTFRNVVPSFRQLSSYLQLTIILLLKTSWSLLTPWFHYNIYKNPPLSSILNQWDSARSRTKNFFVVSLSITRHASQPWCEWVTPQLPCLLRVFSARCTLWRKKQLNNDHITQHNRARRQQSDKQINSSFTTRIKKCPKKEVVE